MTLCAICGSGRNIEAAHIAAKGMGGRGSKAPADAHDTAPLCAGSGGNTDRNSCHGANHSGDLAIRRNRQGLLEYRPSVRYASALRRRGVRCRDGAWHTALYEGADPDAIDAPNDDPREEKWGALVHESSERMRHRRMSWTEDYLLNAEDLAAAHKAAVSIFGPREGAARFREWRRSEEYSDATASRMLAVVKHVPYREHPELLSRGSTMLHQLAVALKAGGEITDLLPDAMTLSVSDFEAKHNPPKPRAGKKPLVCKACGAKFEEVA